MKLHVTNDHECQNCVNEQLRLCLQEKRNILFFYLKYVF